MHPNLPNLSSLPLLSRGGTSASVPVPMAVGGAQASRPTGYHLQAANLLQYARDNRDVAKANNWGNALHQWNMAIHMFELAQITEGYEQQDAMRRGRQHYARAQGFQERAENGMPEDPNEGAWRWVEHEL